MNRTGKINVGGFGSKMPTPQDFTSPNRGMFGTQGTYTDWNAYNSALTQWRQQQEQGRFEESRKLLQDVMGLYSQHGALDQSFQNAKNVFMAKAASDMVMRGMGNLVNMPAINLAYEKEVRPEFEIGKQDRLAQAMMTMANLYANYNPTYEQMAQPMSVTRAIDTGGGGGGSSPFSMMSRSPRPTSTGYSAARNPVAQELDRMANPGARSATTPIRAGEYMMGSDPGYRADYFAGEFGLPSATAVSGMEDIWQPMFANGPYLKNTSVAR